MASSKDVRTPNLDALGRSGVVHHNGYSTAPQCVPSRGGLMTGKFQGRFNLDNNRSVARWLQQRNHDRHAVAEGRLCDGPVRQMAPRSQANEIPKHGFKHTSSPSTRRAPSPPTSRSTARTGRWATVRPEMYHIEGCSRAAASIIERYREQPFFLYVAYRAPHTPLDAPAKYTARFPGPMPERRRQALAMLSAVDDGVGLITSTLKKHGLTERTLSVLHRRQRCSAQDSQDRLAARWRRGRLGRQPEHATQWRERDAV